MYQHPRDTQPRDEKIKLLAAHLAASQPVILSGPAGVGKTALAIDAVRERGLVPVLFEACEGRDIAENEVVLIENFQGLATQTQHDLVNMLRTPEEVETTPQMKRLRSARMIIMSTAILDRDWGRNSVHSVTGHPLPDLRHLLHSTLPIIELEFNERDWAIWAAKQGLPAEALAFANESPNLFIEADLSCSISPRAFARASSALQKDEDGYFTNDSCLLASSFLSADGAKMFLARFNMLANDVRSFDLVTLARHPVKEPAVSSLDDRTAHLLTRVLAMAAQDGTFEAFADQLLPKPELIADYIQLVTARGTVSRPSVLDYLVNKRPHLQYALVRR